MLTDTFKTQVKAQINKGTRHHHEDDIHRAFRELSELVNLNSTEPIEDDREWWNVRAIILSDDRELGRSFTGWHRRN